MLSYIDNFPITHLQVLEVVDWLNKASTLKGIKHDGMFIQDEKIF